MFFLVVQEDTLVDVGRVCLNNFNDMFDSYWRWFNSGVCVFFPDRQASEKTLIRRLDPLPVLAMPRQRVTCISAAWLMGFVGGITSPNTFIGINPLKIIGPSGSATKGKSLQHNFRFRISYVVRMVIDIPSIGKRSNGSTAFLRHKSVICTVMC